MHRIREAMRLEPIAGLLSGRVISDETHYGGKPSNRHGHDPKDFRQGPRGDKAIVMALVSRETGEVRSQVIPNVRRETLRKAISEHVDMSNTHLHTDQLANYRYLAGDFASHSSVNHGVREYVRGDVTTNHAESYFAQLKRSLDGTHHHVSKKHLHRYLAEFDFRYTTGKESDTDRMCRIIGQTGGRRLLYREPTRG
jgi:transposase-like protein